MADRVEELRGLPGGVGLFGGVRIVESRALYDLVDDWSRVRSPGRARRRLKRGYRQNIVTVQVPKPDGYSLDGRTIHMHPVTAAKFYAAMRAL